MAVRLEHTGAAAATTLSTSITSGSTTINIVSATGWPTGSVGPFVTTLSAGTASEEKVLVLSRTGTALTVQTRGYDGTTATSHASGAAIIHSFSATEADEGNVAAVAVGGATGGLVGVTQAQTLTSKTLTAPVITLPTGDVARGTLAGGYAQVTASQGSITANVDLTGLTVTVTVGTSRRIRITAQVAYVSTVAADTANVQIHEGALLQSATIPLNTGVAVTTTATLVLTPSSGSHTYKLVAGRATGTGTVTMTAASNNIAFILVEDIGAA